MRDGGLGPLDLDEALGAEGLLTASGGIDIGRIALYANEHPSSQQAKYTHKKADWTLHSADVHFHLPPLSFLFLLVHPHLPAPMNADPLRDTTHSIPTISFKFHSFRHAVTHSFRVVLLSYSLE